MRMEELKRKLKGQQQQPPNHLHPFPRLLEGSSANGGETNFLGSGGVFAAAAMSGEQVEQLRKQIAAYAAICDQLMGLYRSVVVTGASAASLPYFPVPGGGGSLRRNPPYRGPPMMATAMPSLDRDQNGDLSRVPRRQRWNPTTEQLRILERMFEKGHETPSKEEVKAIAAELEKHGQIADSNVYNWFQNRRARLRKKQQQQQEVVETPGSDDVVGSGAEAETVGVESSKGKKLKVSEDTDGGSLSAVHPVEEASPWGDGSFGSGLAMHEGGLSSKSKWDYIEVNPESYYPHHCKLLE